MKVVIQRVTSASVTINESVNATIGKGLLILLGIETEDTVSDAEKLCAKISKMRILAMKTG